MAIRFQCSACSQPIEVDEEWARKLVACPYCRKTITAPMESTLPEPSEIPTATGIEQSGPFVAAAYTGEAGPAAPPRSNVLAKVAFGLSCAVVVLMGSYSLVLATHQDELRPLFEQGQSFSDGMQAFNEYTAAHGGVPPPWLMAMSLLSLTGGLVWVAALVITGIAPVFFCCGGIASTMPG